MARVALSKPVPGWATLPACGTGPKQQADRASKTTREGAGVGHGAGLDETQPGLQDSATSKVTVLPASVAQVTNHLSWYILEKYGKSSL